MKVITKKALIPTIWMVIVISLAGCWQQTNNTKVNWWTSIQDVKNWWNKVTVNGELEKIKNKQWGQKQDNKKPNKIDPKEAQEQLKKQTLSNLDKIKKEGITTGNIAILNNLYYNKHILSKDKQAEVNKLYEQAKQKVAKKAVDILKQTKALTMNEKQQVLSIIKKKLKDPNSTIDDMNMFVDRIKQLNYVTNPKRKKSIEKRAKEYVIQKIITTMKTNLKQKIIQLQKEVNISKIQFKDSPSVKIDNNKILQVIVKKIKEDENQLNKIKSNISLQEFNNIVNVAKNKTAIKLINKKIINKDFIWYASIPYITYKGKMIDINSIAYTLKTVKLLNSVWIKNIPLQLTNNSISGLYAINMPFNNQNINELVKYAKLYIAIKNMPSIVNLTVKVYNIKNDDVNTIISRISDLITGSFVNYTNVKDIWDFNKLLNKLNNIFNSY